MSEALLCHRGCGKPIESPAIHCTCNCWPDERGVYWHDCWDCGEPFVGGYERRICRTCSDRAWLEQDAL